MDTGEKIRKIRKMSGMTQEELAEKMNVSRQTISKWEKGRKNIAAGYDKNQPSDAKDDNPVV